MRFPATLLFASLLVLAAPALYTAEMPVDSSAGTWKLNLEKSTFGSRKPPKSEVRTYTVTPAGTQVVITDIQPDGKQEVSKTLLTYDGKPQPITGSDNYDTVTTTRVGKNETTADIQRKGKVVGSLRRVVSDDGKTMTMNMKLDKADGSTELQMSVFDKQ
jgi:hypothetical protein